MNVISKIYGLCVKANKGKDGNMKYVYLAKWVEENADLNAAIDSIHIYQDSMYLSLVQQGVLVFVLSPRDSFIYRLQECSIPSEAHEIWRNLRNSRIIDISISPDDRIIHLDLHHKDIYGESKDYQLLCELMPPKPNVILIRKDTGLIQDALYKYSLAENPMRMVLANQPYYPPQTSFIPDQREQVKIPEDSHANTLNEYFFQRHQKILKPQQKASELAIKQKVLEKEIARLKKKLESQKQDLANAEKAEYYHACAEAIKPNMQSIKPGQTELITTNYLDPELKQISVPLLSDKSPQQNLNHYIKKYQKAKSGLSIIGINIARTMAEIEAVEKLLQRVINQENVDLQLRPRSGSMTPKINRIDRILQFRYSDDWYIYIGRKAKENDLITTKLGKPQDWWFHSRIYRGAHVLLRNLKKQNITNELIDICCSLAAWYSQAKFSVNVPVDYTQIRYVRKPKGSAAGFVTYTNYKSVFANPKDLRQIKKELGK